MFTLGVECRGGRHRKDLVGFRGVYSHNFRDISGLICNDSMACGIRECYAAALTVLILVEDKEGEDDD